MNQCDQPHVVSESTSPFSSLPMLKNVTHHNQRDVSNSHTGTLLSIDTSSFSTMDMRATTLAAVDLNIDRITSLERTLCSNFACCGAQLPDLHALLEHFEEDHVVVLAPNGRRVYPPEGLRSVPLHPVLSTVTSPASSRSSSASPSSPSSPLTPSSSTPSSPSDFSSPTSGPFASRKSSLTVTPVYTPFTPSLPVDPAYPYPDTTEIVMAHEPSFEFPPDLFPPFPLKSSESTSTTSSDEDEEMSDGSPLDAPLSPIPTYVYGTQKGQLLGAIPKQLKSASSTEKIKGAVKALNSPVASPSTKSSKAKSRYIGTSSNPNLRRREKAYRCPTPRCTKSYLNPNGLKYHMEKGTCKIDPPCEELQEPSADLTASATSTAGPANSSSAVESHSTPSSATDVQMQTPSAQDETVLPSIPKDSGTHPHGEIPLHPGAGNYCHHNPSTVAVQTHQQIYSSPNVNFNGTSLIARDVQGLAFSIPHAPALAKAPHSPATPQTESQPQYHYPVPSYPQMTGPHALLTSGYLHHPYYQTDRALQHSEGYGPIFPPLTATVTAHSQ